MNDGTIENSNSLLLELDVTENLIGLLSHKNWRVVKPALRAIGNIVSEEKDYEDFTQNMIDQGVLVPLRSLIFHQNSEIQKEACWTVSNIAAGSEAQIDALLGEHIIEALLRLFSNGKVGFLYEYCHYCYG